MIKKDLYGTRIFRNVKFGNLCLVRIIIDGIKVGESELDFQAKMEYSTDGEEYQPIENLQEFGKKWKYLEIR